VIKRLLRPLVPQRARSELFRVRRIGARKAAEYARLERRERRNPPPRAGEPFDVGGVRPIVLDASTVHTVRSHWVDYGHAIKELQAFRRLAAAHELFFDIGAAEGIFAAAFCALTGRSAHAFEPSPEMQGRLNRLCEANPDLAITAHHIALGDAAGERRVRAYEDGQFSGVADATTATDTMTVQTLDAFARDSGLNPDLVKIDVEGMELDVLTGGAETFKTHVERILLEVHWELLDERGQSAAGLQTTLDGLGFDLYDLDFAAIPDLTEYTRKEREMVPGYTIVVASKNGFAG
jgi:FkbM family methyltransferase